MEIGHHPAVLIDDDARAEAVGGLGLRATVAWTPETLEQLLERIVALDNGLGADVHDGGQRALHGLDGGIAADVGGRRRGRGRSPRDWRGGPEGRDERNPFPE